MSRMDTQYLAQQASDEAWRALGASRQSLYGLRVSRLLSCLRQQHYRANRVPPTNDVPHKLKIDASQGTAIHHLFIPWFTQMWPLIDRSITRCLGEVELTLTRGAHTLNGHADAVAWRADNTAMVWDLKTLSAHRFDAVAGGEPQQNAWTQVWCYALILEETTGVRVTDTLIYNIDRSDPEAFKDYKRSRRRYTTQQEFTDSHRAHAAAAIDAGFSAATSTTAPRWFGSEQGKISSLYSPCKSCPWQELCLGKAVQSDDPDATVHDEAAADVLRALHTAAVTESDAMAQIRDHIRLNRDAKAAKNVRGRLKELVDDLGLEPGTYNGGDGYIYELREAGGGQTKDTAAMTRMLEAAGKTIPTIPRAKSLKVDVYPADELE